MQFDTILYHHKLVMERSVLVNGTTSLGNLFEYDLPNRLVASTNTFAGTSSYGNNGRSEVTSVDASGTTNTIENFWGPDLSGTEQGKFWDGKIWGQSLVVF